MYKSIAFLFAVMVALPHNSYAVTACSHANLTRCLDSVCAINISSNPAARCQYCGTADAGTPSKNAMRSVSVGQSAKYTLTDKELKSAPSEPGERYVWATSECLKKVSGCTPDDVESVYDTLIEQSCKAAGISAGFASAREKMNQTKTKSSCKTDITSCIVGANRCGPDYAICEQDENFNKFFASCGVEATGCDEYIDEIRNDLILARNEAIKNADTALETIVKSYQDAREKKLNAAKDNCKDNNGRDACIATVCERSMANKCAAGFEYEKSMATQLCKFYELACAVLK